MREGNLDFRVAIHYRHFKRVSVLTLVLILNVGAWVPLRQGRAAAGTYVRGTWVLVRGPQHYDVLAVTMNLLPVRRV